MRISFPKCAALIIAFFGTFNNGSCSGACDKVTPADIKKALKPVLEGMEGRGGMFSDGYCRRINVINVKKNESKFSLEAIYCSGNDFDTDSIVTDLDYSCSVEKNKAVIDVSGISNTFVTAELGLLKVTTFDDVKIGKEIYKRQN